MTTRRDALLALPFLCRVSPIHAQGSKAGQPKRLGYLGRDVDRGTAPAERPFYVALRQKGWILGDNLAREVIYTDGEGTCPRSYCSVERLAELASELVRKRVDIILTSGDDEAVAAARATRTIPIVFFGAALPVERGLIDSDVRTGRNVTGVTVFPGREITFKRLSFLRDILPAAKRLSWIADWDMSSSETVAGGRLDWTAVLEAGARDLGFETRFYVIRTPQDVDAVFGDITAWRAEALTAYGPFSIGVRQRLAEVLLRHRLPSAFYYRENVEVGGLLSYGASPSEAAYVITRLVDYVDRVLRGISPAELPVERPRRYELVINLKSAKALGLTIPQSLLLGADKLIQ